MWILGGQALKLYPRLFPKGPEPSAGAVSAGQSPLRDRTTGGTRRRFGHRTIVILPQVHLRKPCYDFYFL